MMLCMALFALHHQQHMRPARGEFDPSSERFGVLVVTPPSHRHGWLLLCPVMAMGTLQQWRVEDVGAVGSAPLRTS